MWPNEIQDAVTEDASMDSETETTLTEREAEFLRRLILHDNFADTDIAEVFETMGGAEFDLALAALQRLHLTIHKRRVDTNAFTPC